MQIDKFTAVDGVADDEFGHSVSLANQRVLIGARFNDEIATNAGAAYIINISPTYTVGGTVAGLAPGNIIELQNNLIDNLIINSDGSFTFGFEINDGLAYDVIVNTQPSTPNQNCIVTNGSGSSAALNIYDIQINCTTNQYFIGGSITGLEINNSVSLSINQGAETLSVNSNGAFASVNGLDDESNYIVSVLTNPISPNQTCDINNSSGIINGADITNIQVTCITNSYFIGGMVTGLYSDNYMLLQNNGSDDLTITSVGAFVFNTPILDHQNFNISIQTQPVDPIQLCTVNNGNSSISGNDINNVNIDCDAGTDLIYRNSF